MFKKGFKHSEETKKKISLAHKGKKLSKETRKKISSANMGKKYSEETIEKRRKKMIGHTVSKETRKKIGLANSIANKGQIPWIKGKHHTKETKKKLSLMKIGKRGYKHTKEAKKKMSLALKGRVLSKKHKKNLSISHIGIKPTKEANKKNKETHEKLYKNGYISPMLGKKQSKETKRKIRIGIFKHIKKTASILYPRIGKNEKQILDKLEKELNYKIIRQFKCEGFFIDGYIQEINIAIEVDERPKIKEKDIERETIITNKLNCKFLRIKDYD